MRCYGNVKGRKYYGEQPEYIPEVHSKQRCARCHRWRPKDEFIKDGARVATCQACRDYMHVMRAATLQEKQEAAPEGMGYCGQCYRVLPEEYFTRRGRVWKTCNECSSRKRVLNGRK